jgi:hypothetical protein
VVGKEDIMNTKHNVMPVVRETDARKTRARSPLILRWATRKTGIPEARAEELWREACHHAAKATGQVGTSEYWEAAETRLYKLIERERQNCLPTPELSPWVRLQSRIAHLPLLAAEGWSVALARLLSTRAS